MTKKDIDLLSSKGQGIRGKVYYDELGNKYIGLINGRIVRDTVSQANLDSSLDNLKTNILSTNSSNTPPVTPVVIDAQISPLLLMGG